MPRRPAAVLIGVIGGYSVAARLVGLIDILGLAVVWLFPETRGQPLPA